MRLNFEIECARARINARLPNAGITALAIALACSLFILSHVSLPVAQAQVRRVTLQEMVESAGTVVTGRVIEVREGRHPNYQNIAVTYITVEVEGMLKGKANHVSRHVFMQFGGVGVNRIHELPTYRAGEEAVIFLYPESQYGFTSPVGGGQGKFYLRTDTQTGERLIANELGNARLFDGIDTQKLAPGERSLVRETTKRVDYTTFASLVKRLTGSK